MFYWVVTDFIPLLTTLTSFSHCRIMARHPPQNVWVYFEGEDEIPIKVSVDNCIDVHDLVEATLDEVQKAVHPISVPVTFGGKKVRRGAPVSHYVTATSDVKPLLLCIRRTKIKVNEGEYLSLSICVL